MEQKPIKEGWVVITPTPGQGDTMIWASGDEEGNDIPDVFTTEKDAWRSIAGHLIFELQQFINGERELEDTSFETQEFTGFYQEYKNGKVLVYSPMSDRIPMIETTLDKWRANR